MQKVPVGRSITHAYEFLFGRIFQILGTAWLPALLYAAGYYLWLQSAVTWIAPLSLDHAVLAHGIAATVGFVALGITCRSVIGISLTQEALGIRHDVALAHFVVGPREIRLVFAQIRLLLIVVALDVAVAAIVVLGLGAAVKYGAAIPHSPLIGGKSLVVVGAIAAAVVLYTAFVLTVLKLSVLLTAVAAVEKHAKIRRAWQLAHGSGWRILFVLLGSLLPVLIGVGVAADMLIGPAMAAAMHATAAQSAARAHAILQVYADHAFVMAAILAVFEIVGGALMAGATAAAYRTVTGHEEEEPADDDALVAPLLAPVPVPAEDHAPAPPDHGHGHDAHGEDHGAHGHGEEDHGHGDHGEGHGSPDGAHDHAGSDDHRANEDHGHGDGHGDAHGHDGGHDDHGHGHHGDHHGHDGHHAQAA